MLISSDREIYHSPLIRIQNRRRVFCAGFVCLEAMQAWHGFLFKIPRDCFVLCTLAILHTFAYRGASHHSYAHVCTGLFHIFSIRYHRIAPCFALPQSRTHSHIVVLRPTFMRMCVRGTNPVSHAHASMARLQDCAPGII